MLGKTENFWEHRSFKEQGLDILPQIHLGEKATALERNGIKTEKGNYNREILEHNKVIMMARAALEKAKEELAAIKAIPVNAVNEIIDMIRKVCERNHNHLKMPIFKGKYIGRIFDRDTLLSKAYVEKYVHDKGWSSFADMENSQKELQNTRDDLDARYSKLSDRIDYLRSLLDAYEKYEPYIKFNKELWSLKEHSIKFKKYKKDHYSDLLYYDTYRKLLKEMIREDDKKIVAGQWKKELSELCKQLEALEEPIINSDWELASIDILQFNKKDLERILQNESHHNSRNHEIIQDHKDR